jgi:hypothetical protein
VVCGALEQWVEAGVEPDRISPIVLLIAVGLDMYQKRKRATETIAGVAAGNYEQIIDDQIAALKLE